MTLEQKLQSLLTAANTATGEEDTNLTDAVASLIAGQGGSSVPEWIKLAKTFSGPMFNGLTSDAGLDVNIDLNDFPNFTTFGAWFQHKGGTFNTISIRLKPNQSRYGNTATAFSGTSDSPKSLLKKVSFDGTFALEHSDGAAGSFAFCRSLEEIEGVLSLDYLTSNLAFSDDSNRNSFYHCESLKEVRFEPNSFRADHSAVNWRFDQSPYYSAETLVSMANALKDDYTGTITLDATPKALLPTIYGTHTTVEGYSQFTKTDNPSDETLEYFLTTIKGATIA